MIFNNETIKKVKKLFTRDSSDTGNTEEGDGNQEKPQEKKTLKSGRSGSKETKSATVDDDGYMPFKCPWNLSVSYGIIMAEDRSAQIDIKSMRYPYKFTQNMNFSGNIGISDNWKINFTSGYNFEFKKLTTTTMNISRDLHCFEMSCGIVLAPYTSFNFSFRATSQMLADALKIDKRSSGSSNVDWWY